MADSDSDAAVLVPLYIYPFEGAWQPLYDAIAAHPRTQYLVVVNPGNGPGPGSLPDANYCREIPKLRSQPNVAVYGYVHVQWAQRDLGTVLHDVEIYQAWPNHDATMAVDGIFVDETPTAADAPTVAFLGSLTSLVHRIWPNASGDLTSGDSPVAPTPVPGAGTASITRYRTPLPTIIHNPGCMPARALLELTDLCVVFEDTWTVFLQRVAEGIFDDDYHDRQLLLQQQQQQQQQNEEAVDAAAAADADAAAAVDVPPANASETTTETDASSSFAAPPQLNGTEEQETPKEEHQQQQQTLHNHGPGTLQPTLPTPPPEKQVPVLPDRHKRAVVVHSVPLPAMAALLSGTGTGNTDTKVKGGTGADVQELDVGNDGGKEEALIDSTGTRSSRAAKVREVMEAARRVAGTVFVTELHEGFYERFGPGWGEWASGGVVGDVNGTGVEVGVEG